jgi:hypothetical protein
VGNQKKDMGSAGRLLGSSKEFPMVFLDKESEESLAEIFFPAEETSKGQNRVGSRELASLKSGLENLPFPPVEREEKKSRSIRESEGAIRISTRQWRAQRSPSKSKSEKRKSCGSKDSEERGLLSPRKAPRRCPAVLFGTEKGLLVEGGPFAAGQNASTAKRTRPTCFETSSRKTTGQQNKAACPASLRKGSPLAARGLTLTSTQASEERHGQSGGDRFEGTESNEQNSWAVARIRGGPCWRCGRRACSVWYGSEFGPRSLCYPCYEETRRPGKRRRAPDARARGGAVSEPANRITGRCRDCGTRTCSKWYSSKNAPRSLCARCYKKRQYERARAESRGALIEVGEESPDSDPEESRKDRREGAGAVCRNKSGRSKEESRGIGEGGPTGGNRGGEDPGGCDFGRRRSAGKEAWKNSDSEARGNYIVPRFIKEPATRRSGPGTGCLFADKEGEGSGEPDGDSGYVTSDGLFEKEQDFLNGSLGEERGSLDGDTDAPESSEVLEPDILEIFSRSLQRETIAEQRKFVKKRKEAAEFSRKRPLQKDGDGNGSEDVGGDRFAPRRSDRVAVSATRRGSRELASLKDSRLKESILAPVERKEERSYGTKISGNRKSSISRASEGTRSSSTGGPDREKSLSISRGEVDKISSTRESTETQEELLTVQEAGGLLVEDSPFKAGRIKARPRVIVGSTKTASETKKSSPSQATASAFPGSCVALSTRKEPNGMSGTGRIGCEASNRRNGVVARSAPGGPCCECVGKVGIVGYTGECGPRTLCHRCYNRRRRPGKAENTKPALRASEEPFKTGKINKVVWAGPCQECKRKASLGWYKSAHGPRSLCKTCYHRLWRRKRAREKQAESTGYKRSRFEFRKESHVSELREREEGRGSGSGRNKSEKGGLKRPGKAADGLREVSFPLPRSNADWGEQGECDFDGRSDATEKRGDLGSEKRTYFVPRFIKVPAHIEKESSIKTGRGLSARERGKEGDLDGETGHVSSDASMEVEQDAADENTEAASPEILEPEILEILSRFGRKEMIQEQNKMLKERKEAAEFSRKRPLQKHGDGNGCGQHGSPDVGGDRFVPRRSDRVAVSATRRRMVKAMEWTGERRSERARARSAVFARESVADLENFVGEKGVGFGDCFAFDEFLADCGSRQAKQNEGDSGKGAEGREWRDAQLGNDAEGEAAQQGKRVEDTLLAQIWSECDSLMQDDKKKDASAGHRHDRSCLYFDPDYGRFCTVNGDFFGGRIQDNGRQYRADYDWMGRLLPGWWKRKEPPPGVAETFQPKKRRRLMLEDLPEAPHSQARARAEHCAAVRAAEQRSPFELVAVHGSAAHAAFWAVLGPTRQPFQTQVEGFGFIMKNLTGSVDGLGSQACSTGRTGKRAAEDRERLPEGGAFGFSGKGCIAAHAPGTGKTMLVRNLPTSAAKFGTMMGSSCRRCS